MLSSRLIICGRPTARHVAAQPGEFLTWNPDDKSAYNTLSNGDLTSGVSTASQPGGVRAGIGKSTGKWYWELLVNSVSDGGTYIGVMPASVSLDTDGVGESNGWAYRNDGEKIRGGTAQYGATFIATNVISVLLNLDDGEISYYKNGVDQGLAHTGLTGTLYPAWSIGASGATPSEVVGQFAAADLTYAIPYGYSALDGTASSTNLVWADGVWARTLWASNVWSGMLRTAATVPTTMVVPTGSAGDTEATIYFTALANDDVENGGGTITGYTVTSTPGSLTASGATSPLTVTGLTNSTAYTFTVHATNYVGNSTESAASNSVTPTASGDPEFSSVNATSDGTDMTVTFTTATDISAGVAGILYGIGVGAEPMWWIDVAGAVASQSIVVPYAEMGAVTGDTINYYVGYSATNPAGTKEYSIAIYTEVLT